MFFFILTRLAEFCINEYFLNNYLSVKILWNFTLKYWDLEVIVLYAKYNN